MYTGKKQLQPSNSTSGSNNGMAPYAHQPIDLPGRKKAAGGYNKSNASTADEVIYGADIDGSSTTQTDRRDFKVQLVPSHRRGRTITTRNPTRRPPRR